MVRSKSGRTKAEATATDDDIVKAVEVTDAPDTDQNAEAAPGRTPRLTLRALAESVATATDTKKKVARDVVAATIAQIAEALERGDELVLPPLGKLRMVATRDTSRSKVMKLRLVRGTATDTPATEGLAEAAE